MAKGYVIFIETITDEAGMNAYAGKAMPSLMQAGGRLIALEDNAEVLEGAWPGTRTVILEFDSVGAARNWYRSAEYQAIIPLRQAAAEGNAVIVGGFEMPGA